MEQVLKKVDLGRSWCNKSTNDKFLSRGPANNFWNSRWEKSFYIHTVRKMRWSSDELKLKENSFLEKPYLVKLIRLKCRWAPESLKCHKAVRATGVQCKARRRKSQRRTEQTPTAVKEHQISIFTHENLQKRNVANQRLGLLLLGSKIRL